MTWDYRIIQHDGQGIDNDYYAIHEVYYSKKGHIVAWSANPMSPFGNSYEELSLNLHYMSKAFRRVPLILSQLEKNLCKRAEKKKKRKKKKKKQK